MPKGILRSVGKNGANEKRDVKLIQIYLNLHNRLIPQGKTLIEDGVLGKNTTEAILKFQKSAVGMKNPDGRIDPNGKTFRFLTLYFSSLEQNKIERDLVVSGSVTKAKLNSVTQEKLNSNAGLASYRVIYSGVEQTKRVVSNYSLNVIKLALKESGMDVAVITSTLRTPREQAAIMYKNAKINLSKQYALYGKVGDQVLKVFENNKSKSEDEVLNLMIKAIEEYEDKNLRVSKHCVSEAGYKKLNIIDIGVNSTKAVCKNFDLSKFTAALRQLEKDGYISRMIDETSKSNSCWHLEIIPNIKAVENYNKNTIFMPQRLINSNGYMLC